MGRERSPARSALDLIDLVKRGVVLSRSTPCPIFNRARFSLLAGCRNAGGVAHLGTSAQPVEIQRAAERNL